MADIPGMPIHLRIRELRECIGWSLTTLSKKADISRSYLAELEKGKSSPTYATILKLCAAFDCRPAVLTDASFDSTEVMDNLRSIKERWS